MSAFPPADQGLVQEGDLFGPLQPVPDLGSDLPVSAAEWPQVEGAQVEWSQANWSQADGPQANWSQVASAPAAGTGRRSGRGRGGGETGWTRGRWLAIAGAASAAVAGLLAVTLIVVLGRGDRELAGQAGEPVNEPAASTGSADRSPADRREPSPDQVPDADHEAGGSTGASVGSSPSVGGIAAPPAAPSAAQSTKPSAAQPTKPSAAQPAKPPVASVEPGAAGSPPAGRGTVESRPRPRRGTTGLSGLSQTYSDFHCQRIQHQFGVVVPDSATILEVDGQVLPFSPREILRGCREPILFLPRGTHQVRFHPGDRPVQREIDSHFGDTYAEMRSFFQVDGPIRRDELLSRGARAMDVHATPLLLNLMGAANIQRDQWDAAQRKFRRALQVNPFYGPAHLNLAHCLARQGNAEAAADELRRAEAVNVGNVFGIAAGIAALRQQLELEHEPEGTFVMDVERYVTLEPLSVEDRRLVALMTALAKYAVRDEDRAKILNNLGVHFADTDRPELALNYYRESLRALKTAGPQRYELASTVISHISAACEKAGFAEAEEYRWMQGAVTP